MPYIIFSSGNSSGSVWAIALTPVTIIIEVMGKKDYFNLSEISIFQPETKF